MKWKVEGNMKKYECCGMSWHAMHGVSSGQGWGFLCGPSGGPVAKLILQIVLAPLMGSLEDQQYKATSKLPPKNFHDTCWNLQGVDETRQMVERRLLIQIESERILVIFRQSRFGVKQL